jgi:tetratricopeptide (TPR) repeat protein
MSRKLIAIAMVIAIASCADPDAVTAPDAAGVVSGTANVTACTADQGQQLLDAGQYNAAIQKFTCVIGLDPTGIDGYRGRIEAQLMLGRFSDALRDYTRVTAFVEPVHPDAAQIIVAEYQARLGAAVDAIPVLTGLSFAHWYFFNYPGAMHVLDELLLLQPNNVYGNLFRGSSRILQGTKRVAGAADLENAILLDPSSPHVRYVVADAYTYGSLPDAQRAFDEATLALNGGINTPRVRAILGSSYLSFGDDANAAIQIKIHLDLVTTELTGTSPIAAGQSMSLAVVPGRVYEIPIVVTTGETVAIATSSKDFWDTILVLLAPDGTPVLGSDDYKGYLAGFEWVAPGSGTYRLRVTSFEAVNTGALQVVRK